MGHDNFARSTTRQAPSRRESRRRLSQDVVRARVSPPAGTGNRHIGVPSCSGWAPRYISVKSASKSLSSCRSTRTCGRAVYIFVIPSRRSCWGKERTPSFCPLLFWAFWVSSASCWEASHAKENYACACCASGIGDGSCSCAAVVTARRWVRRCYAAA